MAEVTAGPLSRRQPPPATSYVLDGKHQDTLNEMKLFAKYSAAAYEDVTNWACRVCQEFPELQDTKLVATFYGRLWAAVGYIALKDIDGQGHIIVAFKVAFVGHSLGAALTVMAATQFAELHMDWIHRAKVFTYGQPRIGNKAYALRFSSLGFAAVRRVARDRDLVPHIPPKLLRYHNFNHEYFIRPDGSTIACQPEQPLEVAECSASALGSPHFRWGTHHLIYWDVKFWQYMPHFLAAVPISQEIQDAVDTLAHATDPGQVQSITVSKEHQEPPTPPPVVAS
ncbi:hypothetical protein H4R35_004257 [Dimargaris xerosporica]|nr:hypothetical protein H4R35_004257 [Dimargaris xerosporica]